MAGPLLQQHRRTAFGLRRARSFTVSAANIPAARGLFDASVVAEAKAKCDEELRGFLDHGAAPLAEQDEPEFAASVVTHVRELLACSLDDVVHGRFRDIVNKLRKLQQACVLRHGGPSHGPTPLTKLLLIVSRVTRLAEFFYEPPPAATTTATTTTSQKPSTDTIAATASAAQVDQRSFSTIELPPLPQQQKPMNAALGALLMGNRSFEGLTTIQQSPALPPLDSPVATPQDSSALPDAALTPVQLSRASHPPPAPAKTPATVPAQASVVLEVTPPPVEMAASAPVTPAPTEQELCTSSAAETALLRPKSVEPSAIAAASTSSRSLRKKSNAVEDSLLSYFVEKVRCFLKGVGRSPAAPSSSRGVSVVTSTGKRSLWQRQEYSQIPGSPPVAMAKQGDPPRSMASTASQAEGQRTPSTPSTLSVPPRQTTVLCRICEELVPAEALDEHMEKCARENTAHYRAIALWNRLKKLGEGITLRGNPQDKVAAALGQLLLSVSESNIDQPETATIAALKNLRSKAAALLPQQAASTAIVALTKLVQKSVALLDDLIEQCSLIQRALASRGNTGSRTDGSGSGSGGGGDRGGTRHKSSATSVTINDFEFLRQISKGAFGNVYLARKKRTGDLYAIKRLNKRQALLKNQIPHITAERNILALTNNPFLIRSYYSFQTKENLYLVMEYAAGGDLYTLLKRLGAFSETMTRIYLAQVVLALEYLHSLGIVHRDLKPDNLLVSATGHIKLTDFGLSRYGLLDDGTNNGAYLNSTFVPHPTPANPLPAPSDFFSPPPELSPTTSSFLGQRVQQEEKAAAAAASATAATPTSSAPMQIPSASQADPSCSSSSSTVPRQRYSVVGTPDYLAPEVVLGTGHDKAVDWWALGVIAFEFLTGCPPFNDDTPEKIFSNILNRNITWPPVPEKMSNAAYDLINRLLCIDRKQRLGSRGGAAEVKQHEFFADLDWDSLLSMENALFIPQLENEEDTSYFDEEKQGSVVGLLQDILANKSDSSSKGDPDEDATAPEADAPSEEDTATATQQDEGEDGESFHFSPPTNAATTQHLSREAGVVLTPASAEPAAAATSSAPTQQIRPTKQQHHRRTKSKPAGRLANARSDATTSREDDAFVNFSYKNLSNLQTLTLAAQRGQSFWGMPPPPPAHNPDMPPATMQK